MGEMINWMGGWPKEGVLSAAEWEERTERCSALGGAWRERDAERLKEVLAQTELLPTFGAAPSRIRIAAGADAAIEWTIGRLLQPGDAVLVERPTSRFALQSFRRAGVVPHDTPSDASGIEPDALADSIRKLHPRLVYAAPDCTDPEGRRWTRERKDALLRICGETGTAVLLDERQAILCEPREAEDALRPLGDGMGAVVIRAGELPPGMVAGLRWGWLCVEGDEGDERIKELLPRHSPSSQPLPFPGEGVSPAEQLAVLGLLEEGIEPLVNTLNFICRSRNGVLIEQLKKQRLEGLSWQEPQRGMHMWLGLPEGLDGDALLRASWLGGVLFQPGGAFYASNPDRFKLRITVAHTEDRWIRIGVQRLGEAMSEFLGRWV
ncbi:aminotransferase class I/II-fold pyridoxal phosphate-dependent enzyme [Cohnella fermenti]|nr:aminotransferase class I/II-fold pyridoxal phosphate-dependent enzyme [Cohnella fermenti]